MFRMMYRDLSYRWACAVGKDKGILDDKARAFNELLMPWVMAGGPGAWWYCIIIRIAYCVVFRPIWFVRGY